MAIVIIKAEIRALYKAEIKKPAFPSAWRRLNHDFAMRRGSDAKLNHALDLAPWLL